MKRPIQLLLSKAPNPYRALERRIGYRFRNRALLEEALTHRSYRFENPGVTVDNQRLEFLGDAVLGLLTAAGLFARFPDKNEGRLTELRSRLTSGKALAAYANEVGMGQYLRIGKGEERSGGRTRMSTLADAFEALIGAAYVDGGARACRKIFDTLFGPALANLTDQAWLDNPKGKLQEYCQRRWKINPHYRTIRREGPPHATVFTAEVTVPGGISVIGRGVNKQEAETEAAAAALRKLGITF